MVKKIVFSVYSSKMISFPSKERFRGQKTPFKKVYQSTIQILDFVDMVFVGKSWWLFRAHLVISAHFDFILYFQIKTIIRWPKSLPKHFQQNLSRKKTRNSLQVVQNNTCKSNTTEPFNSLANIINSFTNIEKAISSLLFDHRLLSSKIFEYQSKNAISSLSPSSFIVVIFLIVMTFTQNFPF